jgi:hypothetical protein
MIMASDKYIALFVQEVGGMPSLMGTKKFDPASVKEGITFKGKTHRIEVSTATYREGNRYYFLVDVTKGQLKTVSPLDGDAVKGIDPKLTKALYKDETVRQLVAGMHIKGNWMLVLIISALTGCMALMGGIILQAAMHLIG